jgi:5'-nucleotidase
MSATSRFKVILLSFIVATGTSVLSAPASAGLNILLSNDDGYGSYGITAMQASLEAAGHTVYVSAPAENQSGKSGAINSDYGAAVEFTEQVPGKEWAIEGTPADSVSAALFGLLPGVLPEGEEIDLVVAGVNDGENVSLFTNASGTVGAAMWGLRRGVPAIAVSVGQDIASLGEISDCPPGDYGCIYYWYGIATANAHAGADTAAALVPLLIDAVQEEEGFLEGLGLNVNVPSGAFTPKGIRVTRSDNSIAFDLVIVSDGSGGLEVGTERNDLLSGALVGQVQCQYLPPGYIDYDSEGQAFACGYTTISIVDGNIDASQDTTDQAKDLACSLEDLATIEIFNCDGGDGHGHKKKKNGDDD